MPTDQSITGSVTENGSGVSVTAHVDADNHYGLYYGAADGSSLSYIGRDEFAGGRKKGRE
jgi:hypothetical protein